MTPFGAVVRRAALPRKAMEVNVKKLFALLPAMLLCCGLLASRAAAAGPPPPVSFAPLSIPATDAEKSVVRISPSATTYCCGGKRETWPLEYRVLFRSGWQDQEGHTAGLITGRDGMPLKQGAAPFISNNPDADTFIKTGGNYYLFTHFEESPGAIYLSALDVDGKGEFSVKSLAPLDLSGVGGTLMNCAGSKTPWITHLASEENYWLDAYRFVPASVRYTAPHFAQCARDERGFLTGGYETPMGETDYGWWCRAIKGVRDDYLKDPHAFTPYNYGFNIEIGIDRNGAASVKDGVKRLAMGRFAPEMALVMPDRRTAYMTDDGDYSGFYMFIADDRNDLSTGTLYIAKWTLGKDGNNIRWVPLGHAEDREIEEILAARPEFTDIFDVAEPLVCPGGFRLIKAGSSAPACLRLRDGTAGSTVSPKFGTRISPHKAAAFLETRRYGAWLGGTTEWHKAEGLAFDDEHNALYMAVSGIDGSMLNNLDPVNDIRLPKNICGAVLRFGMGGGVKDTQGNKLHSGYVATVVEPELAGVPLVPGVPYADENACHPDFIANPDNMQYIGRNILLIGEDSEYHFNNYAWAYDVKYKTLTRIASIPTGGEVTGVFANMDTMDRFYIFMNVQHPMRDTALNAAGQPVNTELIKFATDQQRKGYVGYISGLCSLAR